MSEINDIGEIPKDAFPINLKLITKYKRTEPILMAKYNYSKYHKGYFYGGSNIDVNLITCEDNIFIPEILQSYVLHWYHTYLLRPGMDITKAMIGQHFF